MVAIDFSAEDTETLYQWRIALADCAYTKAVDAELRRRGA